MNFERTNPMSNRLTSARAESTHQRQTRAVGLNQFQAKPTGPADPKRMLTMLAQTLRLAERTEALAQQNVELARETKELLLEVKDELKEVKEELREVKEELREVKDDRLDRP